MLAHVVVSGTAYEYDPAIWPDTIRETLIATRQKIRL